MSTKMKPDGVSEMGGVWAGQDQPVHWVKLQQTGKGIYIRVDATGNVGATMSVPAARSLARQLYRLARRQELRDAT